MEQFGHKNIKDSPSLKTFKMSALGKLLLANETVNTLLLT
jgi:hypothetical protein